MVMVMIIIIACAEAARRRANCVSRAACSRYGRIMELHRILPLPVTHATLAEACKAILGAVFLVRTVRSCLLMKLECIYDETYLYLIISLSAIGLKLMRWQADTSCDSATS